MTLRITTLIENKPDDKNELISEHGLSLYIEVDNYNILFDTGQTGDFIHNSKKLNIDLNKLDYLIISHGHYDHSGGFKKLISTLNNYPKLVVGSEFFKPKYGKINAQKYKYIGNRFDETYILEMGIPLKKVTEDLLYLTDTIILFHHFLKKTDFEKINKKFHIREKTAYVHDMFDDEIVLGIITSKGLVVIVGCSHVGIVNILNSITDRTGMAIYAVIGGTHLVEADEIRMEKTVEALRVMNIKVIAVSHCTGKKGEERIQKEFDEAFVYNNTGNVITIEMNRKVV